MLRYHIKIYLSNQNCIDAKAVAISLEDAVDAIVSTDHSKEFIGENTIESFQLLNTENIEPVNDDRFLLQRSKDAGYRVLTDTQNIIVCKFLEHHFNDNQQITDLNDIHITDPPTLATVT